MLLRARLRHVTVGRREISCRCASPASGLQNDTVLTLPSSSTTAELRPAPVHDGTVLLQLQHSSGDDGDAQSDHCDRPDRAASSTGPAHRIETCPVLLRRGHPVLRLRRPFPRIRLASRPPAPTVQRRTVGIRNFGIGRRTGLPSSANQQSLASARNMLSPEFTEGAAQRRC